MNAVRNFIYTRSANFLRTYGQNALLNLPQAQQPPDADGGAEAANTATTTRPNNLSVPKSLLDSTIFRCNPLNSNANSGSLSPNTIRKYRSMTRMLELQYICKLCQTRNRKFISEQAYTSGIVILQCEGCSVDHLIADNIGWFANTKNKKSLEEVLAEKCNGGVKVNVIRVDEQGELI